MTKIYIYIYPPKSTDIYVDALDQSFGLEAAVEEAQSVICSSITVTRCVPTGICATKLGIGVFKIMYDTRLRFYCFSRFALVVT